ASTVAVPGPERRPRGRPSGVRGVGRFPRWVRGRRMVMLTGAPFRGMVVSVRARAAQAGRGTGGTDRLGGDGGAGGSGAPVTGGVAGRCQGGRGAAGSLVGPARRAGHA